MECYKTKRDVCLLLSFLVLELSFAISLKSRLKVFYILCTSFNITFSVNGEPNANEITLMRNTSLSCMFCLVPSRPREISNEKRGGGAGNDGEERESGATGKS